MRHRVHYNLAVTNMRILGPFLSALVCAPLLMGGACEKKKPNDTGAVSAMDRAGPPDTTPLADVDVGNLSEDHKQLFYKLVDSLKSPCGKAHSLRTSHASDTSCKRAPYAIKYVLALIEDAENEQQIRDQYARKYENPGAPVQLDVSKAPRVGNDDAPIRLVEFFDYACPHCAQFKPVLDAVAAEHAGKVVEHFLMYPLGRWPESKSAAQAVLAASQQGKFKEMHALLFEKAPDHGRESVLGYARQLGLDLDKFTAAYDAAAAQVESDKAQGQRAGIESTPALFFNDRKYQGPLSAKYIGMWIEEEMAVNR